MEQFAFQQPPKNKQRRTERPQRGKTTRTQYRHWTYTVFIRRPVYTGRTHNVLDLSLRPFVCPFVCSFVCYQLENALRKRMNWSQCKLAYIPPPGKGINGRPRGLGGQSSRSHRKPKLCLKAWRRHHSQSVESSRWRHTVSDGNVAFERGGGGVLVLHIV